MLRLDYDPEYYPCGHPRTEENSTPVGNGSMRCRECKQAYNMAREISPTYRSWTAMKTRCDNPNAPNYTDYGGRGIKYCNRWSDYPAFLEDMGERSRELSIDRIDNDAHYSCGHCEDCLENGWMANCRWATSREQNTNRRKMRPREYCPNGHKYEVGSYSLDENGFRACKECDRASQERYHAKRKRNA